MNTTTKTLKVGPQQVNSFWKGFKRNVISFAQLLLMLPAFVLLYWLTYLRKHPDVSIADFISLPVSYLFIAGFLFLLMAGLIYRSARDAHLYCKFENDGLLIYWSFGPAFQKKIPYEWCKKFSISNQEIGLFYLKNNQGVFGLLSGFAFTNLDPAAVETFKSELMARCAGLEVAQEDRTDGSR